MMAIYYLGDRIQVPYKDGGVQGILEGISGKNVRGIDVRKNDGTSDFYPISELRGVKVMPLKLKGGITDLCVHVDGNIR